MSEFVLEPAISPTWVALALTIGLRIIPLVLLLPIGKNQFHWQARLILSLLLIVLLTTFHSGNPDMTGAAETPLIPPLNTIISEILAGLAIGVSILIVVEAIQWAAQWIGLSSGVSLRGANNESALAKLVSLTVLAGLIAAGLHRLFIAALLDCYNWLPVNSFSIERLDSGWPTQLSAALTWSFVLSVKLAAPAMITMLAINLTMGWVSRQAPQLHQFVLGIPVNTAVLLTVVMFTLGTVTLAMQQEITMMLDLLTD